MGDIYSEEEKMVLLKFECHQPFDRDVSFGIDLTYGDAAKDLSQVKEHQQITLNVTQDENVFQLGVNTFVMEQVAFFTSNAMLEEAIRLAESRKYEDARLKAEGARAFTEAYMNIFSASIKLQAQYEQINRYQRESEGFEQYNPAEMSQVLKNAKYTSLNYRKGKLDK